MPTLSKRYRLILTFSITLNILFLCFFVGKRLYYSYQGYKNSNPNISADSLLKRQKGYDAYTNNMVSIFKILPNDTSGIVFLGTSLTQFFPLQEMFKNSTILNRGVSANTTKNILHRVQNAIESKPSKLFLEAGTNDIGKFTTDTILNNIQKIISSIKSISPKTKIYYQSVLPFGKGNTEKIEALNNKIKEYCVKNCITFINLYPQFLKDDAMKKELTLDGTHLTGVGYLIWANSIRKYIVE